jgi:Zn-dependent protease
MTETITACPHCRAPLAAGALICPTCHRWVHEQRLQQLLQEANAAQQINPMLAANLLRQAMALLPVGSPPYVTLEQHAQTLAAAAFGGSTGFAPTAPPRVARNDTWATALLKTGGSMALSIYIYKTAMGLPFAAGFVLLILIHEMGHVIANWYYGIKQSPPIFIPYVGAIIWLRQNPSNAKAEAVIGIAGPVAGTAGALVCFGIALFTGKLLFLELAGFAMIMNLFNMIPIAPLDGGRVSAAITPWLWIPGVVLFIGALYQLGGRRVDWITILVGLWILQGAWPRLRQVMFQGAAKHPYYRVGIAARLYVIFSYVLLTGLLVTMLYKTGLYHLINF